MIRAGWSEWSVLKIPYRDRSDKCSDRIRTEPKHLMVESPKMAGWTGLEPATFCVTGRRSNQLSYHPVIRKNGHFPEEIRIGQEVIPMRCFSFVSQADSDMPQAQ